MTCSDSSMVDENQEVVRRFLVPSYVQIPLWSMKTRQVFLFPLFHLCSDSSMVDENTYNWIWEIIADTFRFLYGRWKLKSPDSNTPNRVSSDSSMVDENENGWELLRRDSWVQIPLWSMKTYCSSNRSATIDLFRFLYGRWKPYCNRPGRLGGPLFRFLYGRWKLIDGGVLVPEEICSDSSMVDENDTFISNHQGYTIVQIPLWSMKTTWRGGTVT